MPSAELAIIREAGHVSNMEKPAEWNAVIKKDCRESLRMHHPHGMIW
jgi:pimeloyl-ACP methyl ester carboxylesterase